MTTNTLRKRIDAILVRNYGDSSSEWCGCIEGNLNDCFSLAKETARNALVDLCEEYAEEYVDLYHED